MAKAKKKVKKVTVKKAKKTIPTKKVAKVTKSKTLKKVIKKQPSKLKIKVAAPNKKSTVMKKTAPKKFDAPATLKKIKISDLNNFVTPLDDRMIVQVEESAKRTAGGLYIPDTALNDVGHHEGLVLSIGRGHRDTKGRLRPMDVKVGDRILFSNVSGSKLVYQNIDLKILRETDVMGVVDKD